MESCQDQTRQDGKREQMGEKKVTGRGGEEITAKEKEAKQRGNQSQSRQCHLCLLACL